MTETRQHKIERIYEVIKPTEFGRYVDYDFPDMPEDYEWTPILFVMIWDVLEFAKSVKVPKHYFRDTLQNLLIDNRNYLRKPIEEQSDDTIDYLYSLLPTEDDLKRK